MQETGSHSKVQLDFALGYTEMIWVQVHAARRWWHFQISVAVAKITFPSFHLACFAGLNGKIQNSVIIFNLSACTQTQIFLSATFPTLKISHMCMRSHLFQQKTLRPVPNVRQLAINTHSINWTNYFPPVMSTQTNQLNQCLCIDAVVFLYCYSNVPPQSCVLQVCQTARKAQLASSVLSGILSTCSDYSEDVDTDASVFSLSLQAEGRTPPYYKNKA